MKSVYLTWKWKYDSGFDFWLENTSKEYERKRSNEEYSTKKKEKEKRTASHPTTSASVKGDELHKQCAVMNFKFNTSNSFTWNVPPHSVLSIYLVGFFSGVWSCCCSLFARVFCACQHHLPWKWIIMSRIHMKSQQISFWIWHHFKFAYVKLLKTSVPMRNWIYIKN